MESQPQPFAGNKPGMSKKLKNHEDAANLERIEFWQNPLCRRFYTFWLVIFLSETGDWSKKEWIKGIVLNGNGGNSSYRVPKKLFPSLSELYKKMSPATFSIKELGKMFRFITNGEKRGAFPILIFFTMLIFVPVKVPSKNNCCIDKKVLDCFSFIDINILLHWHV